MLGRATLSRAGLSNRPTEGESEWSRDRQGGDITSGDAGARGRPGYELPLLLFGGFRAVIDRLHAELAQQGHPDVRPSYGFAMQGIGLDGASASELGRRLGVSKQAAGKTIDRLVDLGYAERVDDTADSRRKLVHLTPRGLDALRRSAQILELLRNDWSQTLGAERLHQLESDLRTMLPIEVFRLDVAGWFS